MKVSVHKGRLDELRLDEADHPGALKRPAKFNAAAGGRIVSSRRLGLANALRTPQSEGGVGARLAKLASGSYHRSQRK